MRGYSFGAVDYMVKPVNDVVLLSKVRVFLELHRNQLALRCALEQLSDRNRRLEREVSERRLAEEKVRHLAHHDGLTGLGNRLLFMHRLEQAIAPGGHAFALVYIDIDGFKAINDTHSHQVGDDLLKLVGARLRHGVRGDELVARLGGDEFAAIVQVGGPDVARERVAAIARSLFRPYSLASPLGEPVRLEVNGSLGAALFPHHGADAEALIHAADSAMYTAKRERSQTHLLAS